jgi:Histidine kinase-like ATPase domain
VVDVRRPVDGPARRILLLGVNLRIVCGVNICPVMDSRIRALYKIQAQPGAPAEARRIIAEELSSRLPGRILDDIKLMVSELVAGGIVDGSRGTDQAVVLDLGMNGEVRCSVRDHGTGFAKRVAQTKSRGWGLRVVEQLSDRWGMQCSPDHTEVWFERHYA